MAFKQKNPFEGSTPVKYYILRVLSKEPGVYNDARYMTSQQRESRAAERRAMRQQERDDGGTGTSNAVSKLREIERRRLVIAERENQKHGQQQWPKGSFDRASKGFSKGKGGDRDYDKYNRDDGSASYNRNYNQRNNNQNKNVDDQYDGRKWSDSTNWQFSNKDWNHPRHPRDDQYQEHKQGDRRHGYSRDDQHQEPRWDNPHQDYKRENQHQDYRRDNRQWKGADGVDKKAKWDDFGDKSQQWRKDEQKSYYLSDDRSNAQSREEGGRPPSHRDGALHDTSSEWNANERDTTRGYDKAQRWNEHKEDKPWGRKKRKSMDNWSRTNAREDTQVHEEREGATGGASVATRNGGKSLNKTYETTNQDPSESGRNKTSVKGQYQQGYQQGHKGERGEGTSALPSTSQGKQPDGGGSTYWGAPRQGPQQPSPSEAQPGGSTYPGRQQHNMSSSHHTTHSAGAAQPWKGRRDTTNSSCTSYDSTEICEQRREPDWRSFTRHRPIEQGYIGEAPSSQLSTSRRHKDNGGASQDHGHHSSFFDVPFVKMHGGPATRDERDGQVHPTMYDTMGSGHNKMAAERRYQQHAGDEGQRGQRGKGPSAPSSLSWRQQQGDTGPTRWNAEREQQRQYGWSSYPAEQQSAPKHNTNRTNTYDSATIDRVDRQQGLTDVGFAKRSVLHNLKGGNTTSAPFLAKMDAHNRQHTTPSNDPGVRPWARAQQSSASPFDSVYSRSQQHSTSQPSPLKSGDSSPMKSAHSRPWEESNSPAARWLDQNEDKRYVPPNVRTQPVARMAYEDAAHVQRRER
eukprot:GEMP01002244.1.p1 GENE.GEMP01002244.1~~GEMP01002244.1.p1  ORF type:complete len:798 (+),score=215.50 GEMP01002244.1:167-2560(+)